MSHVYFRKFGCMYCGSDKGGQHCDNCGWRWGSDIPPENMRDYCCPHCGEWKQQGNNFCTGCGGRIKEKPSHD
jgi:hypothetical protein